MAPTSTNRTNASPPGEVTFTLSRMVRALLAIAGLTFLFTGALRAQAKRDTITTDGVVLQFLRQGKGHPLFIVGSSIYYPKAFSQQLTQRFDMVFADNRHFVPSYAPTSEQLLAVTMDTFTDEIESVRLRLGIGPIAVLGHSVHAQIALAYARKYPEHVSHLILVAGVPFQASEYRATRESLWVANASAERQELLKRNQSTLDQQLRANPPTRSFAIQYSVNGPLYWSDPSYNAEQLLRGLENSPALGRLRQLIPNRAAVRSMLEALRMPVLVVVGWNDFSVPFNVWEELARDLPHVEYYLIREASHNPQTEHATVFDRLLIDWFKKHP